MNTFERVCKQSQLLIQPSFSPVDSYLMEKSIILLPPSKFPYNTTRFPRMCKSLGHHPLASKEPRILEVCDGNRTFPKSRWLLGILSSTSVHVDHCPSSCWLWESGDGVYSLISTPFFISGESVTLWDSTSQSTVVLTSGCPSSLGNHLRSF